MGSKENRRTALYQKLKQLRSLSYSNAEHNTSVILDATKYIEELKEKVERLNDDITNWSDDNSLPLQVTVETLDKGFQINVFSEEDCPGLLVSILEAFEELGLDVCDANVSSSNKFHLQAICQNDGHIQNMDANVVKQAILKAIKNVSERNDED